MKTVTAMEIHSDLVLEADIMIEDALTTLEKKNSVASRADRLKAIGFTGVRGIDSKRNSEAEVLFMRKEEYAMKYPGLKFVPTEAMMAVCKKYGLIIGTLENYTGDVPEWALEMIEKNQHLLKKSEPVRPVTSHMLTIGAGGDTAAMDSVLTMWIHPQTMELGHTIEGYPTIRSVPTDAWGDRSYNTYRSYYEQIRQGMNSGIYNTHSAAGEGRAQRVIGSLVIAAPRKDMKTNAGEMVQGLEIVDPIVSIVVEGGYCVVVGWGAEGQDPRILNADNN